MIKIFMVGAEVVDGEGIKGFFQKHLKTGGGLRQKLLIGEGGLKVSLPLPP